MLRPRVIPSLLVHQGGLVKTQGFKSPKYVGDPINAVRIFNEKEVDELIILDIDASANGTEPDYRMISSLALECRVPLCYGGGVKSASMAKRIISLGVEKVAISSVAVERPEVIVELSNDIGNQSVVVALDVKKRLYGSGYDVVTHNAKRNVKRSVFDLVVEFSHLGAGELLINSVDLDGKMTGYDMELASKICAKVNIPVTMLGGASCLKDIEGLFRSCGVVGAAAGSLFVFKGKYKAVLINYPTEKQKDDLIANAFSEWPVKP